MRCRKVRSYLSAYCNDELSGRKKLAIDEHLSNCAVCRKEEAIYYSLNSARNDLGSIKVSNDFNTALLNRIARERFAETRTKAYLPQNPPILTWSKVIPAVASALVMVLVAISVFNGSLMNGNKQLLATNGLDNSYLTAQPTHNPNMTVNMNKNWSLDNQLAKTERVNTISNYLTKVGSFSGTNQNLATNVSAREEIPIPFVSTYYRVRPVIRVYIIPDNRSVKEGTGEY